MAPRLGSGSSVHILVSPRAVVIRHSVLAAEISGTCLTATFAPAYQQTFREGCHAR
jgi:hypothetical protein